MLRNFCLFSLIVCCLFSKAYHLAKNDLLHAYSFNSNVLMIPKISFKEPFYDTMDPYNDLNYGIMVLDRKDDAPLVLASHSGDGIHSYFKHLEKLSINDEFFILSAGFSNRYVIKDIFYKEKDGILSLSNVSSSDVILLTCSKKVSNKQVYFIGKKV